MINRHNYEEYFLMYVDNELTSEQRSDVELFLQQNPDLRQELDMLQQTKLSADEEIMFAHKTDLLKIKDSVDLDNYEELFLLYVDNELNENGKEAVEKFVLQHPQLQDEFTLLKQTVLPQEKITFPNKKLLYKKEERRLIPYWTRIAAAAAFIGIAALVWWMGPHANNNNNVVATVQPGKQAAKPADSGKQNKITQRVAPAILDTINQFATAPLANNKKRKETGEAADRKKSGSKPVEQNIREENRNIAITDKPAKSEKNIVPVESAPEEKSDPGAKNDPVIVDLGTDKDEADIDPLQKAKSKNAMNDKPDLDFIVQPAAYKELNTNDDDNLHNTLYIGNMGVNKNKVRGLMKKVGGLFAGRSKNASDEKGKLQVANFELNTN